MKNTQERLRRTAWESTGYLVSLLGFILGTIGIFTKNTIAMNAGFGTIGIGLILTAIGYTAHTTLFKK